MEEEPVPHTVDRPVDRPVDRTVERLLRRAVLDHATSERRRVFPPAVHVGVPGRQVARLVLGDQRLDHALRTDVLEAMVRRTASTADATTPLLVWLTRRGPLELQDIDVVWRSAAGSAAAEMGRALPFVVIDRHGWRDPRTGASRTWQRIRAR